MDPSRGSSDSKILAQRTTLSQNTDQILPWKIGTVQCFTIGYIEVLKSMMGKVKTDRVKDGVDKISNLFQQYSRNWRVILYLYERFCIGKTHIFRMIFKTSQYSYTEIIRTLECYSYKNTIFVWFYIQFMCRRIKIIRILTYIRIHIWIVYFNHIDTICFRKVDVI